MNILLVCNAGMSTGIMQLKLTQELKARNIEGEVKATALAEINEFVDKFDVVLLGPQIRFAINEVKEKAGDKLVMVIAPQDFGTMNAKKVKDDILKQVK